MSGPADFTHLHVHSEYSLLDGMGKIAPLLDETERLGMDSIAITDHGALYGSVEFVQEANRRGIKPIIGVETYVARRGMRDREGKADQQPFHLVLLATDDTGYRNLCRLVTDAHLDGMYYKPRIDLDLLAKHSAGLIGLSACLNGEVARALEGDDWNFAVQTAGRYAEIFGKERFYLEVQDHGLPEQRALNEKLFRLAPEVGLPLVLTNDLHYVHDTQVEAHDVLLCIGTASNLETPNRMRFNSGEFFLKSPEQMARLFPDRPELLTNTRRIADAVSLKLQLNQVRLPDFPVPAGESVESWLRKESEAGLRRRYGEPTEATRERLAYELGVIERMGYAAYFLIVADFVRFAREQGIATTCRGSAPGSIVTYALGITPVDPIHYELPFERFLNEDRVTMPDIDIDFEDGRREEVIRYVARKYGEDRVAQIITFGTMAARASLRDVGRVLGKSFGEVDKIAKTVPEKPGTTLAVARETPDFRAIAETAEYSRLVSLAEQLEGVVRNASTHAAGVVISREPLAEMMALQRATNSEGVMTQLEMHSIEALGLLKFDFLGLANLTILRTAVERIRESRDVEIDLDAIPLDDKRTFDLLASGETTGIFQLESAGMRRYIRELRPTSVYDLAAMVALYRPGPMANIPTYIRRKHGQEPVTYLHPLLEPFLKRTYGVFVYQEDIMAAARALGGFSGPKADTLGYAIRKKQRDVLAGLEEEFIRQAAERGVDRDVIARVFEAFEPFANYGFNKAHATCYGMLAYQTAYLKANYTVEYMTSVLNAFRSKEEKVAAAIAECRRLGIEVLPPDVERSSLDFEPEGGAIRFGLLAIKNVGAGAAESIVAARTAGGPFKGLRDFCERIDLRLANKRVLEALAKAGAMSTLGHPAQLLLALDDALAGASAVQRERSAGQVSLFDADPLLAADSTPPLPDATEAPVRERLRWEKELLGVYLSDHPMNAVEAAIAPYASAYIGDFRDEGFRDERAVVGAIVTGIRSLVTKAGAAMAIVTVEDLTGSLEVVAFPKMWETSRAQLAEGEIVLVAGRTEKRGEDWSIIAEAVLPWEEAQRLDATEIGRRLSISGGAPRRFQRRTDGYTGLPPGLVPEGETESAIAPPPAVAAAPTERRADPVEAPLGAVLHIRFALGRPAEATLHAMEQVKRELASRPGGTRVVVHVPQGSGVSHLPMEVRNGVAWDAALAATLRERAGEGGVEVELITPTTALQATE